MSLPLGKLLALQAISNGALTASELPARLKLLNWGDNVTTDGIVKVGNNTVRALAANQVKFGYDRIALDYNHNSLKGHPNYAADPREVAAYSVPEVVPGDGLYINAIEYTPSGNKFAREYSDLSPTPLLDQSGEVIFLHSVALCPQGAVHGLRFFSAEFPTDPILPTMNPDLKKMLCALFGADENATDEALLAAGKLFAESIKDKVKVDPMPENTELKALGASFQALLLRQDNQERSSILEAALRDGKIVPLSAKDLPLDKLRALAAELPSGIVPLDRRTVEGVQAFSALTPSVDDEVRKQMGISKEAWEKHNS